MMMKKQQQVRRCKKVLASLLVCLSFQPIMGMANSGIPTIDPTQLKNDIALWKTDQIMEHARMIAMQTFMSQMNKYLSEGVTSAVMGKLAQIQGIKSFIPDVNRYIGMFNLVETNQPLPLVSAAFGELRDSLAVIRRNGMESRCKSLGAKNMINACIKREIIRAEFLSDLEKSESIARTRSKQLEDLRNLASELKLPKEHNALQSLIQTFDTQLAQEQRRIDMMQKKYDSQQSDLADQMKSMSHSTAYGN